MCTLANIEDPDAYCCISSGSTLFLKVKNELQLKEYNIILKIITGHNGLSQVYCMKPVGRIL